MILVKIMVYIMKMYQMKLLVCFLKFLEVLLLFALVWNLFWPIDLKILPKVWVPLRTWNTSTDNSKKNFFQGEMVLGFTANRTRFCGAYPKVIWVDNPQVSSKSCISHCHQFWVFPISILQLKESNAVKLISIVIYLLNYKFPEQ